MEKYDAILFDFDGVLIDSEPLHCACWGEVLAPLDVTLDWETYSKHCIGIADREMLEFLASRSHPAVSTERLWQEYPEKNRRFLARVIANPPFPAATVQLLKELKPGLKLAVVSSSGRAEVEPVLAAGDLLRYFDTLVCGDDVERRKPAPDPYLLAAAQLGVHSPLVIEDSVPGVESAKAAGFDVLRIADADGMAQALRTHLQSYSNNRATSRETFRSPSVHNSSAAANPRGEAT